MQERQICQKHGQPSCEMRRNRYQELTEQKAAVAEVDGDMDQLSQFTLKQL